MTLLFSLLLGVAGIASASPFYAAAGKADVTPDLKHERTYMAGFGAKGRPPKGVHDPLYARAVVVSDGDKIAAMVTVDCIGLEREDVQAMRRELGWDGVKRYLFVTATHTHSGPDTLGLWGPLPGVSGVNRHYRKRLIHAVVELVRQLSTGLQEADLRYAKTDVDPRGLCKDSRDPVVIDPELDAVQLRSRSQGKMIGTIIRWSCHPEASWSDNYELTADYPGALCARVEDKTGGACLFQSGLIGGLMTPDIDHGSGPAKDFEESARIGKTVADAALAALRPAPVAAHPGVSFESRQLRVPVENSVYLAVLPSLTFGHKLETRDGRPLPYWKKYWLPVRHLLFWPLPESQRPWVETEVSRIDVGPVAFLGIPGEMFPEVAIGGYDGRYRFGHPLVQPGNPNPPKLESAPKGPYLRAQVHAPMSVLVGLANDELGYIMPAYDFKTRGNVSMLPRLPGDHYEETNSIGPAATDILVGAAETLLRGAPAGKR